MAVAFVNAGAKGSAADTTITLGAPATPLDDDIWIAVCHSGNNVAHTFSDWTELANLNGGGTSSHLSVWYFVYAGSTPNLIVGQGVATSTFVGGIAAFRGADPADPFDTVGATLTGTLSPVTYTAFTPGVDNCMIVACSGNADNMQRDISGVAAAFEDANATNDPDNCYWSSSGSPDSTCACQYVIQAGAADTGSPDEVIEDFGAGAANRQWASILLALQEPGGAPAATLTQRMMMGIGS